MMSWMPVYEIASLHEISSVHYIDFRSLTSSINPGTICKRQCVVDVPVDVLKASIDKIMG